MNLDRCLNACTVTHVATVSDLFKNSGGWKIEGKSVFLSPGVNSGLRGRGADRYFFFTNTRNLYQSPFPTRHSRFLTNLTIEVERLLKIPAQNTLLKINKSGVETRSGGVQSPEPPGKSDPA